MSTRVSSAENKKVRVQATFTPIHSDFHLPSEAFARLVDGSQPALLVEGVAPGLQPNRYAYIALDPVERLKVVESSIEVTRFAEGDVHRLSTDKDGVAKTLSRYLSRFELNQDRSEGTGLCVIAGQIGYEFLRTIESVSAPEEKTHDEDGTIFIFRNVLRLDLALQEITLISHSFLDRESIEEGRLQGQLDAERIQAKLRENSARSLRLKERMVQTKSLKHDVASDLKPVSTMLGREKFSQAVLEVKKRIRKGDIFQCVISDQFEFEIHSDPLLIYQNLRRKNPSPYHYLFQFGDSALVGASPERLVSVQEGVVATSPIAGTRPRSSDPRIDQKLERELLKSPKERAEHMMLVDLGRNDIGRVSRPGTVKVENMMHVQRFSHVMHLVSDVTGLLEKNVKPLEALAACFPAGTLSGAPKVSAMHIISQREPIQRGPYGGALVFQDFIGNMDSCICIRSLYVRNGRGYIRAGAGIVADSQPSREYEEVLNKAKAVIEALACAEACENRDEGSDGGSGFVGPRGSNVIPMAARAAGGGGTRV